MKLSLCITTYNRPDLTLKSFEKVVNHPKIDEIVISDDRSTYDNSIKLLQAVKDISRVRLHVNSNNHGMSMNKKIAISKAKNEYCISFDSDNILYPEYLDSLPTLFDPLTIFCPVFAEPDFDFTAYSGLTIDRKNAKRYIEDKMFRVFLNCCNYVVNRENYLNTYEFNASVKESDTIWFNYLWLKAGGQFHFVPGMKYFHRVHEGSGWLKNHRENVQKAKELEKLISLL